MKSGTGALAALQAPFRGLVAAFLVRNAGLLALASARPASGINLLANGTLYSSHS
jgi:hypothetical protein